MEPESRFGLRVRRGTLPGPARLEVTYHQMEEPGLAVRAPSGERMNFGVPIDELRRMIGGSEGYIEGPDGIQHRISIPDDLAEEHGIVAVLRFRWRQTDSPPESET